MHIYIFAWLISVHMISFQLHKKKVLCLQAHAKKYETTWLMYFVQYNPISF